MAGSTDNTDILTGLNQVIQALNDLVLSSNCTPQIINNVSMTCNCGSGGAGGTADPPSDTDTGDPGDHTGDPPDGFDTWTEYDTYKCNVATKIIDDLLSDLNWFDEINPALLTLAELALLAAAILSPVPGDELTILLVLVSSIIGFDGAVIGKVIDAVQDNYDELICTLYNATNATGAEGDLEQALSDAIDTEFTGWNSLVVSQVKSALNTLISTTSVNRLFGKDETLTGRLPTGDCSECGGSCPEYRITFGTFDPETGYLTSELETAFNPDRHEARIEFYIGDEGICGGTVTLTITEISGSPYNEAGGGYRIFDETGTEIYRSNNPPSSPVSGAQKLWCNNHLPPEAFTIQVEWTDDE